MGFLLIPIERHFDHIIIGQGLAGSALAIQLIGRGKRVLVIDQPSENHCSKVAAGLFNPITGKGIVQTWMAEELFTSLTAFYRSSEQLLSQKLFFPQLLYRPFYSAEEQNNWMAKSSENYVSRFVEKIGTKSSYGEQINDVFGGILLKASGYLDVPSFLEGTREYLIMKDSFQEGIFNSEEVIHNEDHVLYQNIRAQKIIFCTGISTNPFFNWLKLRPLKGETLTLRLTVKPNVIFNRGVYIVPFGGTNLYKSGATYELKDLSRSITSKGKEELEDKLKSLLRDPYEVISQDWGIRPTTIDRRPMLGCHPKFKNLIIFNGLGTKGVSLAPYFSNQLADWLDNRGEILPEVNIKRFKSLSSEE